MQQRIGTREAGFTFAELAFGLLILVISATVLINHLTINFQTTLSERDRVFAYSKAQAMLSEIQSFVDRGEVDAAMDLDSLDDGVTNKPVLSIQTDGFGVPVPADHVLSGNFQRSGDWVWKRRITVQPLLGLNNRNVRYVTVRIYKKDGAGIERAIADLSAVVNSGASAFPTTQVFDVYFLAVENIPGWWVYMDAIRPFMESTITDLEIRNPGLEVRTHWITKASYGRNEGYRPYINESWDSLQPIPSVYTYPGLMPGGSASTFYYVPENIKGRLSVDGVERNGYDANLNPFPYALADFYNHGMRHPDEVALHNLRVAAVEQREAEIEQDIQNGLPPRAPLTDMSKEPTLRMLLEDLNTDPDTYRNALIINLHGELLPLPAIRNYSDAARDPENLPEIRVVTHPEELRTHRDPVSDVNNDDVVLRVYAHTSDKWMFPGPPSGKMPLTSPICVEVMDMDLTDSTTPEPDLAPDVTIQQLTGGATMMEDYLPFQDAKWDTIPSSNPSPPAPGEMFYAAQFVDPGAGQRKFTRVFLFNTPVRAWEVADSFDPTFRRGIWWSWRAQLYSMDYIPTCTEAARDFSRNLYTPGDGPKNTARWTIRIDGPNAFQRQLFVDTASNYYRPTNDVLLQVRTRIWSPSSPDPTATGVMFPPGARNQPDNLSTTYTWWADSPDDVPITERSQFQGDPRHCPYKDVLNGDPDFPNGYNWFFDSLDNRGEMARNDFPGLNPAMLFNRWQGRVRADVPRYMELLRKGLTNANCVYTTLTGFSYYYIGFGNDIGYDSANGYPNSIPSELTPYGWTGGIGFVNNITGVRRFVFGWTGMGMFTGFPWLGELYPDSVYATQWMANDALGKPIGNLDAGWGIGEFFREVDTWAYWGSGRFTWGTEMLNTYQMLNSEGCTSFFNVGTSGNTFHHQYWNGTGDVVGAGQEIADNYNFPMPTTAPISRPFSIATSWSGTEGTEWSLPPYSNERFTARMLREYYDHSGGNTGSGLVELVDPINRTGAFVVVNGIDRTVQSGSSFIAKFSLLSLVHSFFEAGDLGATYRIKQPARVEILTPTDITELVDPVSIDVQHDLSWSRWDGAPYTAASMATEDETEIEYVLMYSNDGGTNWFHLQDDSPATPGERPTAAYLVPEGGPGPDTFTWGTPTGSFPEGSYHLLVEAYRQAQELHYSYHRTKIFIRR